MEDAKEDLPFTENGTGNDQSERQPSEDLSPDTMIKSGPLKNKKTNKRLSIKDIKLTENDLKAIEKQLAAVEKDFEKSIEETPVNVQGVYISVIVSIMFIVLTIIINRVEKVAYLATTMRDIFERSVWQGTPDRYFADIKSLDDLDRYYRTILIPGVFERDFINNYNYVVGMRLTFKRSNVIENTFDEYDEAVRWVRQDPTISAISSTSFGETKTDLGPWKHSSGGFGDQGGYVDF